MTCMFMANITMNTETKIGVGRGWEDRGKNLLHYCFIIFIVLSHAMHCFSVIIITVIIIFI